MSDPMAHETFVKWFTQRQEERAKKGLERFNLLLTIYCNTASASDSFKVNRMMHDQIMECPVLSFGGGRGGGPESSVEFAHQWETDGTTPTFCTWTPFNHETLVHKIQVWVHNFVKENVNEVDRLGLAWYLSEPLGNGFRII